MWLTTVTFSASCWPGKKKVLGSQWRPILPDPGWDGSSLLSHFQALFLLFSLFHVSPAVISLVVFRHLQPWTPPVLLHFPALKEPHSTGAHPSTQQSYRWDAVVSPPLPRTFRVLWKMSQTFKHTHREGQLPCPKPGTPHFYSGKQASRESRLLYSPEVTGTGSGRGRLLSGVQMQPQPRGSLALGHPGGGPTSPAPCPPPSLSLGPPTPRRAPGLAADVCGPDSPVSSMKFPLSLPLGTLCCGPASSLSVRSHFWCCQPCLTNQQTTPQDEI